MKRAYYQYVLLYIFSYAALGVLLPLIGQYLDYLKFTGTQIGTITSMGTATSIFATTFWGGHYANSHRPKMVVFFLCGVSAFIGVGLLAFNNYWFFLIMFMVLYFFQSPIMGLSDAMTIESGYAFGAIRKWGSIGFALATFLAGRLADELSLAVIFPVFSVSYVISMVIILRIVGEEKRQVAFRDEKKSSSDTDNLSHQKKPAKKQIKYRELIKNRKLVQVIVSAFFIMGTNVANNTYFGFLFIEGGGTLAGVGVIFLLMVSGETLVMALSKKISNHIGLERSIFLAMILSVLRFGWYATGPSDSWLMATFLLQGIVNGIVLVEFVRYIHKIVEPEQLGMGISLFYAVSRNLSTIVCQLIGGLALDYSGGTGVYFFFAIYNTIGVILYIVFRLYKRAEVMAPEERTEEI